MSRADTQTFLNAYLSNPELPMRVRNAGPGRSTFIERAAREALRLGLDVSPVEIDALFTSEFGPDWADEFEDAQIEAVQNAVVHLSAVGAPQSNAERP